MVVRHFRFLRHEKGLNASVKDPNVAKELAEVIRARVRDIIGCEVSIGISHNVLLAHVVTRKAKPAGSYHIFPDEAAEILAPLNIKDIRGFGGSTRSKVAAKFSATALGDLAKRYKGELCDVYGKKTRETFCKTIRGIDDTKIESDRVRKSVSCEINYGIRFENQEEAEICEKTGDATITPGQSLQFKKLENKTPSTPPKRQTPQPILQVKPPSQELEQQEDKAFDLVLPSFPQVDTSVLAELPEDIRRELEQAYGQKGKGTSLPPVAGPSRIPDTFHNVSPTKSIAGVNTGKPSPNLSRITRQLVPKFRPSVSPSKPVRPMFARCNAPPSKNGVYVSPAELKLLNIDAEVWDYLPVEVQREQLAALRTTNIGKGMAIRGSMSTQAKQERILQRWRVPPRASNSLITGTGNHSKGHRRNRG
ncbi:hypothetical protein M422DRAFT_253942 [Sphaerobolus stellatus SS14]|uniref:UmuC domain-containing protein n=1 Tax=Sphaerobolus stellatus (strain SS14) TaxID=990650 RepID=A0A0C9UIH5_SPHS4|nr:hypothetical protein M422DRAFT_253942 [Sphaerobolus stellatus SS14]